MQRLLKRGGVNLLHLQAKASGREDAAIERLQALEKDLAPIAPVTPAGPGSDAMSPDEFLSCDSNGQA
jgi:hypothetical protein